MLKKKSILLLTLLLTFTCFGQAFANSVECIFNGAVVSQEMSAKLMDNQMMVTMDYMAERLGAEYQFDQKRKQADIKYQGKTFQVKADTQYLKVNDRQSWLDRPAKLENDRLFVSPYVVKRIFGVQTEYNKEKNTFSITAQEAKPIAVPEENKSQMSKLLDVSYQRMGEKDQLVFNLSQNTTIKYVKRLNAPERLVVDFSGTEVAVKDKQIEINSDTIKQVRIAQNDPNTTRLVIDLTKKTNYHISPNEATRTLTIELGDTVISEPLVPVPNSGKKIGLKGQTIVIDPGHGGKDPGAIGPIGTREKDVVLGVSLQLYDLLQKAGAKPVLTRDADYFVDLVPRADKANTLGADLFVSVHANSAPTAAAGGIETYSYNKATTSTSAELARPIQNRLVATMGLNNRGIRTANYSVLRNTTMPAILIELGFISNPTEEKILGNPDQQQKMAAAIFQGIADYCGE